MTQTYKKLRRPRRDRLIGGVCAGLGDFFSISPNWFRLALLIAILPGGFPGILAYLILWLVIPGE